MTYCVVWKSGNAAFIAADSAITSYGGNVSGNPKGATSLGQQQGYADNTKYVCEGAFKIFSSSNAALCLSGDVDFGHEIVNLAMVHLENKTPPFTALTLAHSNYTDFKNKPAIKIAVISFDSEPRITVLTNRQENFVSNHEHFVELGSPPRDLIQYTTAFHNVFNESWKNESRLYEKANEFMLIRMLSLLQIYGMHNRTLPNHGIGGSFTGLYITKQGIYKQPDICYVLCGEAPELGNSTCTLTQMKSDHFCIVSTYMCLAIGNGLIKTQDDMDRMDVSLTEAQKTFDSGRFDYVVILNKSRHTATALQLNKQLHHSLLSIDISKENEGTIGFAFSKKLMRLVNDNYEVIDAPKYALIAFIGFEEAPRAIIEEFEQSVEDLKARDLRLTSTYPLIFSIIEGDTVIDSYLGCAKTVMPFIKHFKEVSHITISDWQSGELKLEYKYGRITDAPLNFRLEEHLDKIPSKSNNLSIFSFILEPASTKLAPRGSQVLAKDWADAEYCIKFEVDAEPEMNFKVRRAQKIFYHQNYNRPET